MDRLTSFGLFAVTLMLLTYALEDRSRWFVLAFAVACALGSVYGFLQGASVRAGRGDLGCGRAAALWPQAAMTSAFSFRQEAKPCSAL
jgi:hypothetical protein